MKTVPPNCFYTIRGAQTYLLGTEFKIDASSQYMATYFSSLKVKTKIAYQSDKLSILCIP